MGREKIIRPKTGDGDNAKASGTKPRRSEKSPVGRLLQRFRVDAGMTVSQLATETGVSHSFLSKIEGGFKRLNEDLLLKIAAALSLKQSEVETLRGVRDAEQERDNLSALSGFYINAERLMERECREDVKAVWVLDPLPLEKTDDSWRAKVARNLESGKSYVYFLGSRLIANQLREFLQSEVERPEVVDETVTFIRVPEPLHDFFFMPIKVLWHLESGEHLGAWAFRGRTGMRIDGGLVMDRPSIDALADHLKLILTKIKAGSSYVLDPDGLPFDLIKGR